MSKYRLFPAGEPARSLACDLFRTVKGLPIVSPHGHTDPAWYARNINFENPAKLFIIPDHYIFRMLYSQGVRIEDLGIAPIEGGDCESNPRRIWRRFAENYFLFRGTPSRIWIDHALYHIFGIEERLGPESCDRIYDRIDDLLQRPEFAVRSLYERFGIEVIATTDSPLDDLGHHRVVIEDPWPGRVVPAFRPDPVLDPEYEGFSRSVQRLGELTDENTATWTGYLKALAQRREFFKSLGCTSTDHGHPTPATADLPKPACQILLDKALARHCSTAEAELFRAQMLTEMIRMSLDDGLVVQIHPGAWRNHNRYLFTKFGRDMGADIPRRTEYVQALKPMLDLFGNESGLTLILFTLDESTYSRELAPLAGHYPILKLGPAWWFGDSPEGMQRYRRLVVETAGFYNTVGFNDDTRAFMTIPARHDMARRIDCAFLAHMVVEHRLTEDEAVETARDLAYELAKKSYNL